MERIGDRLRELALNLRRAADAWHANARPLLDEQRRVAQLLQPAVEHFCEVERCMQPTLELIRQFERAMEPVRRRLQESLDRLPEAHRAALEAMGRHGWFLDPDLPLPSAVFIAAALERGDTATAEQFLCDHFDGRLDVIEARLCERFPDRVPILHAAFEAHRSGTFALSVPVFLAQADGICFQLVGVQLYGRDRQGQPKLAQRIGGLPLDFTALISAHPLTVPLPVSDGRQARATWPAGGQLNRHAILHGEDVAYGTRVNGCRTVSLLAYVSWVLDVGGDSDAAQEARA